MPCAKWRLFVVRIVQEHVNQTGKYSARLFYVKTDGVHTYHQSLQGYVRSYCTRAFTM